MAARPYLSLDEQQKHSKNVPKKLIENRTKVAHFGNLATSKQSQNGFYSHFFPRNTVRFRGPVRF